MALLRRYEGTMAWVSADEQDNNCIIFHYQTTPTQEQIDTDYLNYVEQHQYDQYGIIHFDLLKHKELLKWFIQYIKDHPTITLAQYNTLLNTKQWWEAAVIRFFVYMLAIGLAEQYELDLTAYTEVYILGQIRDWIVANPIKKIAKIVLGNPDDI